MKQTLINLGYTILSEHSINQNRDLFIVAVRNGVTEKFYVKYRKDPAFDSEGKPTGFFQTFSKQFPDFYEKNKDLGTVGESINLSVLANAIRIGADKLCFVYGDNKILCCYPRLFMNFALEHNLIRRQYLKLGKAVETTLSIPIKLLNPFEATEAFQQEYDKFRINLRENMLTEPNLYFERAKEKTKAIAKQ